MSLLGGIVVGMATWLALDQRVPHSGKLAIGAGLIVVQPLVAVLAAITWLALSRRHSEAARRRAVESAEDGEALLAHTLLVALSGGLNLATGIGAVRHRLDPGLAVAVDRLLREARRDGLGMALQSARGPAAQMFRQLGAAHVSGAPMVLALSSYAHELHERRRAESVQAARRLPVKMVFPLTLLMLPGFVLLTIGPTAVTSFQRLFEPLAGR